MLVDRFRPQINPFLNTGLLEFKLYIFDSIKPMDSLLICKYTLLDATKSLT